MPELVARRLRVRKATLEDLLGLFQLRVALDQLPADPRPSQIVRVLSRFAPRTLLTARLLDWSSAANEWLDRFMAEWRHIRTAVTGDDLRAAGLPPGPVYARILDELLAARLDGLVVDDMQERRLLADLVSGAEK